MTGAMKKSNRSVSKKEDLHFKAAAVKLELVNEEEINIFKNRKRGISIDYIR